jgi:hypothetical protein
MTAVPRTTMSERGQAVHLVARWKNHTRGPAVLLCGEPVDVYWEPVPGAPLCQWCRTTHEQIAAAVAAIEGS